MNNFTVYTKQYGESSGEAICRNVLEKRFNKKFPRRRPNWNVNPETERCLELDGYNEELGLAFEYNGRQHYIYTPQLHNKEEDLEEQKQRDEVKLDNCDLNDVYLITISYNVPLSEIEELIILMLEDFSEF